MRGALSLAMSTKPTTGASGNQGEGDKVSARHYNDAATEFAAEGKVPAAAESAKEFVEAKPGEAASAERAGKQGPKPATK